MELSPKSVKDIRSTKEKKEREKRRNMEKNMLSINQ